MLLSNGSTKLVIENWFIPMDVVMLISTSFVVFVSFISLLILIFTKTNRSILTLLICNSYLSELMFASVMFSMAKFSLLNDLKEIESKDSLCVYRGYLSYTFSAVRSHSYLLQSLYRYFHIKCPTHSFCQSAKKPILLIILSWILSIVHPFPFLFSNQIEYDATNQVCHMLFEKKFSIFYTCFLSYLNPIGIIIFIYFKLVRYVQRMSQVVTPVNQLLRIKREFQMVRRIVMLIIVLVTLGLPYTIFFSMSFFTSPPKYHFRIAFFSVDLSLALVIIALFQFTDPISEFLNRLYKN